MIACRVEDLPAPFGPMRPTISPGPTSSESPRTAATGPYRTSSASTASVGPVHDGPSWTALSPR